jgi:hypothetical protein
MRLFSYDTEQGRRAAIILLRIANVFDPSRFVTVCHGWLVNKLMNN